MEQADDPVAESVGEALDTRILAGAPLHPRMHRRRIHRQNDEPGEHHYLAREDGHELSCKADDYERPCNDRYDDTPSGLKIVPKFSPCPFEI
jgi:hypothetical protein